ncbi:hypothetical protein E1202_17670 [Saccharopolyspora karakumensis]|uniref:Uncharacterized protein n=1 Tax=Saccharopolyspora karakumensis TaxID=2530386 RepID=A0A4R5BNG9_9PSEU|nr:hypothetical protein [Saccharopolyspora karakumensis]TDD86913.1 hypothetical protein E1202_17670 [Saccharopolyspora karakumensis]
MTIDHLSRMSMGVLQAFVLVVCAAGAVASFLRESTTSKAIVNAAARGASRYAVPSPDQVRSVTGKPAEALVFFGWGNAVLAGLPGVIGLIVVLADGDDAESALIFSLVTGYALVMAFVGYAGTHLLTPAHERRHARIAAHWSSNDEGHAWKPAKQARRDGAGKKSPSRPSIANRCLYAAAGLWLGGVLALQLSVLTRCAGSPGAGKYECEETTYSSPVETLIAGGFWVFIVLISLGVVLAALGVLFDWRQRASERAALRAVLADPSSDRPAEDLLAHHSQRQAHPLARVGAAMSGACLVFSTSSYLVGRGLGLGSEDVFAPHRTESLAAMVVSAGMFVAALIGTGIVNVRGRELRNALMERWPSPPSWKADEDGKVQRAKRGPALHGSREVKVGADKTSDPR